MSTWNYTYWQNVLASFDGWQEKVAREQQRIVESLAYQARVVSGWSSRRVFSVRSGTSTRV